MNENKDTKFPEPERLQCYDYSDYFMKLSTYEIQQWFKRMIEDFPERTECDKWEVYSIQEIEHWFEKWFSQFRNKRDKE